MGNYMHVCGFGFQCVGGWGSALGRTMRAFDSLWGQRHRPDVGYVLGYGDYGLGWSCRGGGRLKFRKLFEVPIPCFYPLRAEHCSYC